MDQKNNVAESRRKLGDEVILLGNFDPYGTLVKMDVSQVEAVIKKCIDDFFQIAELLRGNNRQDLRYFTD